MDIEDQRVGNQNKHEFRALKENNDLFNSNWVNRSGPGGNRKPKFKRPNTGPISV